MTPEEIEEVTQSQYDLHVAYEMSKTHCSRSDAIKWADKLYVVTEACEQKWRMFEEMAKANTAFLNESRLGREQT